jgi:predicted regulator of Ras-like GTPase activity (Roadblock/LC7/MglB family)
MSAMSNSVKIKFAGMLRGLLRRLDDEEATAPETPRARAVAAPPVTVAPVAAARPQMTPPASPPAPTAPTIPLAPVENSDELQLPLQSILAALPMELRAKVMQTPPAGTMIAVPLEKILTQLAFGSVKIAFGELRKAAPGVFVNSGGEHDHKPVMLPLNEILTRLNPALLSRRSTQKQVEVAEDITGPFGAGGEGVKISVAAKPTPSTAMPPLRMTTPPTFSFPARGITPATSATTPPPQQFIPYPPTPATSAPTPPPRQFVPHTPTPATGATTPHPRQFVPHAPTPGTSFITPRSNGAPKPAAPIPSPAPQIPVEPAAISAPLAALSGNWPEGLRLEIRQSDLANAQVLLPANLIEPALKRGRIIFTWQNLRSLIKPTSPPVSIHDGIELELPLNVIAPLFFARQKTALRSQAVERPPAEIPNLFFGFPQPETSQPKPFPQPETPQLKPPPARMPAPQPKPLAIMGEPQPIRPASKPVDVKPVDAKLADTNYYIWSDTAEAPRVDETEYKRPQRPATDFSSRYATPNEIVARAMALPGVVGALVALPDGLKVASQIPSDLNADTLAAFLPQIFDRVSQSTKELRMGALNNFNFTVGNVPWKIFRVNAVYFAAFGHAGEALPTVQLAALAAELDRKKQ